MLKIHDPRIVLDPIKNTIALNKLRREIRLHSMIISEFGTGGIKNVIIINIITMKFIESSFTTLRLNEILEYSKLFMFIKK
jgi:hypothetical protein